MEKTYKRSLLTGGHCNHRGHNRVKDHAEDGIKWSLKSGDLRFRFDCS